MFKQITGMVVAVGLMVGPAFADSIHIGGDTINQGGSAGASASAGASSSSSSGVVNHNSNTNYNTNVGINTQGQSQRQGQAQGQLQGQAQNNQQQISPSQSTKIQVDAPLVPGVAVAPGLTSGGTQVCLGSFSVGLSGPMAGVAFGKTVIDKGCERRQNAVLLFNMGYQKEALELLKGDESVAALFAAPKPVASVKAPTVAVTVPAPTVSVERVSFQGGE